MCGQLGVVIGKRLRPRQDIAAIGELFTRLLVLSEHRGPYASGAAWLDASGSHRICKTPETASRFVAGPRYAQWHASIPSTVNLLMGHTRWPTQGSHLVSHNNHPLSDHRASCRPILLTHNGSIPGVNRYFARFGLPRRWGVDSEILVRLARRHALPQGIDVSALLRDMSHCAGHIAAVLAWATHPDTVIFIRRDKPLFLAWHSRLRILAYASERIFLEGAIGNLSEWNTEDVDIHTALIFSVRQMPECVRYDFA